MLLFFSKKIIYVYLYMNNVQRVIFPKIKFTKSGCINWLKKHKYSKFQVDEKQNFFRYR